MPNEIIQAVNRLAVANKKHRGIMFTDKFGNVINDNIPEESDIAEITGVSTGVGNTNNTESTGVAYTNNARNGAIFMMKRVQKRAIHMTLETTCKSMNTRPIAENPKPRGMKHTVHKNMKNVMMKNQQDMTSK